MVDADLLDPVVSEAEHPNEVLVAGLEVAGADQGERERSTVDPDVMVVPAVVVSEPEVGSSGSLVGAELGLGEVEEPAADDIDRLSARAVRRGRAKKVHGDVLSSLRTMLG